MKTTILSFAITLISLSIFAQNSDYTVKGIVEDTLGNPLIYSTVLLLEADSTMLDYARSELDGSFQFKDVPAGEHIVKTTYLGYIPLAVDASSTNGEDVDLGIMKMTEIAAELMEVVIKAAKAPMKMRGDTIEYDASTFKVPEGSTVEDLLRRLPGIEVEADGSINADGKSVSEVTVDGKAFFGSDPKAATKNLPAEGISKVQVFDRKSEEEEITGTVGEAQDKTMNLELKEDFKSGGFGKIIAGVGSQDGPNSDANRAELKGNYNKFNSKIQFSLVGVGNNTGRNGLSWDDYQDFMGSQSFNFSDGSDYGFGGGGRHYIVFGGDGGSSIEQSIQSVFFSGRRNTGFPENYNGGVNFNYDHNKTKLSSVYYYNQVGLLSPSSGFNDKFYDSFTQSEISESTKDDVSKGHRVELDLEQELDSLHTIKIEFNSAYIDQNNVFDNAVSLSRDGALTSESSYKNNKNTDGHLINGLILLRKKFMKKGRRMGLNVSYLTTELNDDWTQNSTTDFYDKSGGIESGLLIDQINNGFADKKLFKANALFVEPLSKKFFFQVFYNYRNRNETGDRLVTDIENDQKSQNDFLSRDYNNQIGYNRIGSTVRYSHNGINLTTGLAYQSFNLDGTFASKGVNGVNGTVEKVFNNWTPNLSLNFSPARNAYVSMGYTRQATEPSIQNLQPLVDNINPLYVREGNASLTPQLADNINFYMSRSYPLTGVRLSFNGNLSFFDNQFSTSESVDENLVTTVQPINIEGGNQAWMSVGISFPFKKNKFTTRINLSTNFNNRPAIVNTLENNTKSVSWNPSVRFNITPSQDFTVYVNARYGTTNTSYDLNPSQDQNTKNTALGLEVNTKLIGGFFMSSNFDYNKYTNDRFRENREIPILNASIYRRFMEGSKLEMRLSMYDALDKNIGFYQGAFGVGVSQTVTNSLGRHVMLTMTYNIRGMQSDQRKKSWF